MAALLELRDVHTYYGHIHALKGISLTVNEGEVVTLIGSNGAGKSTTLRTISGLLRPRQGEVLLQGQSIAQMPPHKIVQSGIGHVPEGRGVFPALTVLENLEMGAYLLSDHSEFEKRISNVLLWQSDYAELIFLDRLWPDFAKDDLESAIREFQSRDRRYGAAR